MVDKNKNKELIKEHWEKTARDYQKHRDITYESLNFGLFGSIPDEDALLGDVKGKKVIELGCGGGEGSITLALRGALCTGIDMCETQLQIAKQRAKERNVNVKFLLGDIENLSMLDADQFDMAFSIFCFDWAQDLAKVFKEAWRVLKDDGILVFTTQHPVFNCMPSDLKKPYFKISYFQEHITEKGDDGITITYLHPRVSDVFNSLVENGFRVEKLIEPQPTEAQVRDTQKYTGYLKNAGKLADLVPTSLTFKAKAIKK
ncbi:MAG: class I SAM-dependent methyltransferase [Candidatus Hodarchaeota archaeon]